MSLETEMVDATPVDCFARKKKPLAAQSGSCGGAAAAWIGCIFFGLLDVEILFVQIFSVHNMLSMHIYIYI